MFVLLLLFEGVFVLLELLGLDEDEGDEEAAGLARLKLETPLPVGWPLLSLMNVYRGNPLYVNWVSPLSVRLIVAMPVGKPVVVAPVS